MILYAKAEKELLKLARAYQRAHAAVGKNAWSVRSRGALLTAELRLLKAAQNLENK